MASRMKGSERRALVLRAAAGEFGRGGYFETTMADVAARAGVSQPYVQRLFGSKNELFLAAVEFAFDETTEALTCTLARPGLTQPNPAQPGQAEQNLRHTVSEAEVLAAHARLMAAGTSMHLLAQAIAAREVAGVRDLLLDRGRRLRAHLEQAGLRGAPLEQLAGELLLKTVCTMISAVPAKSDERPGLSSR